MIKYMVGWSKDSIEEIEILRETENFVFLAQGLNGSVRQQAKISTYARYYDSWDEAFDYLMDNANKKVISAERDFKDACETRVKIESLRENR